MLVVNLYCKLSTAPVLSTSVLYYIVRYLWIFSHSYLRDRESDAAWLGTALVSTPSMGGLFFFVYFPEGTWIREKDSGYEIYFPSLIVIVWILYDRFVANNELPYIIASKALIGTLVTKQGTVIPNVVGVITSIDSGAMPRYTPLNGLPFSMDIVCLTAFYFLCGFTMRAKCKDINNINT